MALDKVLVNHLDDQDILEDQIEEDIEKLISSLKLSDLINGSEDALLGIVGQVQELLKEKYYPTAAENGIDLAKDIEKDGDIIIEKTKDPNLNEDDVDINGDST